MDYEQVIKFSFAWLFKKETLKYALIIWAQFLLFSLLFYGGALLVFGSVISAFLANPLAFISEIILSPETLLSQLIPLVLLFVAYVGIVLLAGYFVGLYISVLLNFYAFRSTGISYAQFPVKRLLKLFVLQLATGFLVLFSWVHRKAWVIPVLFFLGEVFLLLALFSPFFALVGAVFILLSALILVVFPLYLFFKGAGTNAIVTHRYFLLFAPLFVVLLLVSIIQPLFLILLLLLLIAYICAIIYNALGAWVSTQVFLGKGTGILESIRGSLGLTDEKKLSVALALLLGGIIGALVFWVVAIIAEAMLSLVFIQIIPDNLWGLTDLVQLLLAASQSSAYAAPSLSLAVLKQGLANIMAQQVWAVVIAPFSTLFGVFLTVGIYFNLLPPETKAKSAKAAK
jgi:hypothetical protein